MPFKRPAVIGRAFSIKRENPASEDGGANNFSLIRSAQEFYDQLTKDISAAKFSVRLEMYMVMDGKIADSIFEAMTNKARAGLYVAFIYDSFGSFGLSSSNIGALKEAGVKVREYRPINPGRAPRPFTLRTFFRRDHRKLAVIDENVYYVGGMNIGERFLDWEDLVARGEGRPAQELATSFDEILNRKKPKHLNRRELKALRKNYRRRSIEYIDSRPIPGAYPVKRTYIASIRKAKQRVLIAQAYFVPRRRLIKALRKAVGRGADVRVVIPDKSDVPMVDLATWPAINRLIKGGVKVSRYREGMLHSKLAVIDNSLLIFGSANLDSMSLYWNREVSMMVRLPEVINEVASIFHEYEAHSKPVTIDDVKNRSRMSKIASRLLKPFEWFL